MKGSWAAISLRLALGAALLLLGSRMAFAAITLGLPIEVPKPLLGPPDAGSLAVLEDGSFALGRRTGERRFEVLFFAPDGTRLGEPVTVIARNSGNSVYGGIGPFGDRYFVTWSIYGSGRARAAFFSRDGEPLGSPFAWPYSDTTYSYQFFHYARGSLGRILPFFYFQSGKDRLGYPTYAAWSRVFGPEAKFLGRPVELLTERHFLGVEDGAINEQGRFVVSWLRCPRNPRSHQTCTRGVQTFDGAWRPRSPVRNEGVPPVSTRLGPLRLGMARTGEFLAAWIDLYGSPPGFEVRVFARIFRRDGSPAGQVLRLNGPGNQSSGQLRVRATHARNFAIGWLDSPGLETNVYLREIEGRTGRLGERLLVWSEPPDPFVSSIYAFEFELNSAGHGVVWYGDHLRLVTVEPDETEDATAEMIDALAAGEPASERRSSHD